MRHCVGHHLAEELCTRFLTDIVHRFTLQALLEVEVKYLATVSVENAAELGIEHNLGLTCDPAVSRSRSLASSAMP